MTDSVSSLFDLHNRTAVITGSSSGIGHAIAGFLAEAGARVVLVARRKDRLHALVESSQVNGGPADTVTPEKWNQTIQLNLSAPFFFAQALVPGMRKTGYGRIINIASLQSVRAFPDGIAYGASKGGVCQLTRAMAEAWSPNGITCNAIAPGFFPTELTGPIFESSERRNWAANQTAMGRNGELEDLAGISVFLASPASGYITGQTIFVDGGFTAK